VSDADPLAPAPRDPAAPERHLTLEGAWNFRDLGGYTASGGRTVRWRTLFRADGLDRLTTADLTVVAELGLRTVVDLRTPDEVAKGRYEPGPDSAWHHLPMLDVLPPPDDFAEWVVSEYIADQYVAMLEGAPGAVRAFLGLLTDADAYPLVFHCFAGKDRTGILTALVLGLLGVADEDIAADYSLSKVAMTRLIEWLRAEYPDGVDGFDIESRTPAIAAADPRTMLCFLDRVRDRHGSFDRFAAGLGASGVGEQLRDLLLTD
jgi:protein tyrosine/serine phosphatase